MPPKQVDPELVDYKFKELGRAIGRLDKKMDDFISESVKSRSHFQECMTKIKINITKNDMRIGTNVENLENHVKAHNGDRNKAISAGGGLGGFFGAVVSFIVGAFSS